MILFFRKDELPTWQIDFFGNDHIYANFTTVAFESVMTLEKLISFPIPTISVELIWLKCMSLLLNSPFLDN